MDGTRVKGFRQGLRMQTRVPRRHFLFPVLGGYVINGSQYESTISLTIVLLVNGIW